MTYRVRVGSFVMPLKTRKCYLGLRISRNRVSLCLRLCIVLSMLIVMGGDVEENPGPGPSSNQGQSPFLSKGGSHSSKKQGQRSLRSSVKQTTLASNDSGELSVSQGLVSEYDFYGLIMTLKTDLNKGMENIRTSLNDMNTKITAISNTCHELQTENEQLKESNKRLNNRLSKLESNFDKFDAQSRRYNLLIEGCQGSRGDSPLSTEQTLRNVLKDEFLVPGADDINIEKAYRMPRCGTEHKPTILVRFYNIKDKDCVLKCARTNLSRDTHFSVSEDYTIRVRKHRYELGKHMIEARKRNQFAIVRYDKLIIDENVYTYDDYTGNIKLLRKNQHFRPVNRAHGYPRVDHNKQTGSTNENRAHGSDSENATYRARANLNGDQNNKQQCGGSANDHRSHGGDNENEVFRGGADSQFD